MAKIKCPWCEYEMTDDDMQKSATDLWEICPSEGTVDVQCPVCGADYVVSGSYEPKYEVFKGWEQYYGSV